MPVVWRALWRYHTIDEGDGELDTINGMQFEIGRKGFENHMEFVHRIRSPFLLLDC